MHTLNNIHDEFAATQIDKANNNVEFIFQWFYALAPIKEFGSDLILKSMQKPRNFLTSTGHLKLLKISLNIVS